MSEVPTTHTSRVIEIDLDPANPDYGVIVRVPEVSAWNGYGEITETVDLSPNPTWPTTAEAHDLVAAAVARCLDRCYEAASGEAVER